MIGAGLSGGAFDRGEERLVSSAATIMRVVGEHRCADE
jgi:hypothetical protein